MTHSAGDHTAPRQHDRGVVTYGPRELMALLDVSENTIYRELQYGFLKDIAFRVGRQWRVSEDALERLMAGDAD